MLYPATPFDMPSIAWTLIGVALFFNTAFTALYYILSHVLNAPTQMALAKENVIQLFFSGFIIFFFIASQGIVATLVNGLICLGESAACNVNVDHLKTSYYALELLKTNLINLYSKLYLFEVIVAVMSSMSMTAGVFRIFLFVVSVHISPFIGLTLIANVQVTIVESIGYALGLVIAKESILEMVSYAIPVVFLPLGLFFRSLPWLRSTGSTILALCFTLYFVLPLALIFTNYIIFDIYEASSMFIHFDDPSSLAKICGDGSGIDGDKIQQIFLEKEKNLDNSAPSEPSIWSKIGDILTFIKDAIVAVFHLIWDLVSLLFNGGGLLGLLNPMSYFKAYYYYLIQEILVVSQFLVLVIITTVLEFILIVTAHRSISAVIGGETEVFGLSKIV